MTNHHDDMRVAPDPALAEELRQRLHARLASAHRDDELGSDPSADPDRELPEGDIIMLETDDRPTGDEPTTSHPRSPGRWLLVAAAVAVVAAVGAVLVAVSGDDEEPVETATSPTTTAAPAAAPPQNVLEYGSGGFTELEPGGYFLDADGDDTTPLRVTYQVAAEGWDSWFGAVRFGEGGVTALSITTVTNLVSDGCLDHTPLEPPVGPTVDDLATALSQLAPFEVTAPPTDVELFGYQGQHLELTSPAGGSTACPDQELHSWISPLNGEAFSGYDGSSQTEEFWILDVEGTRLVIVKMDSPTSTPEDIAERDAIFDSISIEP